MTVEEGNVQTLLPAACLLQLAEIQEACCEFLKRQLDPSNCLGIRAFADTHSCRELLRIADKFTQHNFQEVKKMILQHLSHQVLKDLMNEQVFICRAHKQVTSLIKQFHTCFTRCSIFPMFPLIIVGLRNFSWTSFSFFKDVSFLIQEISSVVN